MNIGCFIDENRGISNIQMKKKSVFGSDFRKCL